MQEHEKWIIIAQEDLMVAKTLLKNDFFSTATYHCQQATEKALKGYLAFRKHEILKTHDLMKLNGLCIKFDRDFEKIYDLVEFLNPFATKFRYPTEFDIPEKTDVKVAISYTKKILDLVCKKIALQEYQETI